MPLIKYKKKYFNKNKHSKEQNMKLFIWNN